jgi:2-polyprenyl-3-methyl-5-hydroxy-6-metoxy-1,4-benzoquinol methylase
MKTEALQRCGVCKGSLLEVLDEDCNVQRCRTCGYVFDNPRPRLEELIAFYSRPTQYNSWLDELGARDRLWKRRLSKLGRTKKAGSLLDVGSGIGQFLSLARNFYTDVYGTEVSSTAIQIAKEKYQLELFAGTLENPALQGKTFDNITLFHVLEHVPDPRSVLETCYRLLCTEGVLVIAVPNEIASLRAITRRILTKARIFKSRRLGHFGLPRITLDANTHEVHLSHFTPAVLHRLLEATGFSVIQSTLDPYYVLTGWSRLKQDVYYNCCLALSYIFRVNLYDAMLVIARKNSATSDPQRTLGPVIE